ncbi:MAG: hypothetical protein K2Y37_13345 [Pirellulales bacterium]|nr:hypothetical protein [Pirellulales bacterium]
MHLNRTSSIAEFRLNSRFGELRDQLSNERFACRLEKPLAYWALPKDRRLPLAFMGRTVHDLLSTPFEDLLATPGVGEKKIQSLLDLLDRVAVDPCPGDDELPATSPIQPPVPATSTTTDGDIFNAVAVSEVMWSLWRQAVERYGLGHESLGRFAPSLERLPRVLWHTPLSTYSHLTLAEIRGLKTHGEKRVAAVLEVFHELYQVLSRLGPPGHLSVRIVPRVANAIEEWLLATLERPELPSSSELFDHVVLPLVDQVRIDAGAPIAHLVEERLGIVGDGSSVRQTASNLGLTRARIYQLLADVGEIVSVRWPEGQYLVGHLVERLHQQHEDDPMHGRLLAAMELFFPGHRGITTGAEGLADDDGAESATRRRAG